MQLRALVGQNLNLNMTTFCHSKSHALQRRRRYSFGGGAFNGFGGGEGIGSPPGPRFEGGAKGGAGISRIIFSKALSFCLSALVMIRPQYWSVNPMAATVINRIPIVRNHSWSERVINISLIKFPDNSSYPGGANGVLPINSTFCLSTVGLIWPEYRSVQITTAMPISRMPIVRSHSWSEFCIIYV